MTGNIIGEERRIGEKLEIAVMVFLENTDESIVQQGFTSEYAEELRTVTFALPDDAVYLCHRQAFPSALAYPATTASQVTGLSDRNHVEGGEEGFASPLTAFKLSHIP